MAAARRSSQVEAALSFCDVLQVGVVSDYDLLALDQLGQTKNDKQLFPQADETWQVRQTMASHSPLAASSSRTCSAAGCCGCRSACIPSDGCWDGAWYGTRTCGLSAQR
jgi:hypothetical protein